MQSFQCALSPETQEVYFQPSLSKRAQSLLLVSWRLLGTPRVALSRVTTK